MHADRNPDRAPSSAGRPAPDPDLVARVLRSTALVEERIHEPIAVHEMADAACYSLFHFCRVFAALAGYSPYDYAMRRRLSEAVPHVAADERSLLDIALDHGFQSPEGFSRAFRRMFGLLPSEARDRARGRTLDRRLVLAPLDAERLGTLAGCRLAGVRDLRHDVTLHVRITSAASTEEALANLCGPAGVSEDWCGVLYPSDQAGRAQVCAFAGMRAGGGPAAETAGYPSAVTIRGGQHHAILWSGTAARLPLVAELVWSVFWPRLGGRPLPDRLVVAPGDTGQADGHPPGQAGGPGGAGAGRVILT